VHPERPRPPSQPHPPSKTYVRSQTLTDPRTVRNPSDAVPTRVENAYELLTPGTWYLDQAQHVLYYKAKAGENPNAMSFVAARLENLMHTTTSAAAPLHDVSFQGLEFSFDVDAAQRQRRVRRDAGELHSHRHGRVEVRGALPVRPARRHLPVRRVVT
jgi:hypothetical protein